MENAHPRPGISSEPLFETGRIIISPKVRARLSDKEIQEYLEAHTRLACDGYKMHWDMELEYCLGGQRSIPNVFFHGPDEEEASDLLFILTNCWRTRTVLRFADETLKQRNWEKTCRKTGRRPVPGTWERMDYFKR